MDIIGDELKIELIEIKSIQMIIVICFPQLMKEDRYAAMQCKWVSSWYFKAQKQVDGTRGNTLSS